ncbi:hypothetical protein [Paraburkholderia caledonica]|uniref:hypothetical protein n=1 Tax=Paraburkholderia caledonica TaxID=134536 RepID=UPI000DEF003B|nr:hypothetical protein [Paraburkholderia caledonica]AXF18926.1 hypothetical protein CUJ87_31795 [Paraburkholderia caledonica]
MNPLNVRLSLTRAPDFVEDLTAWANAGGIDPHLLVIGGLGATTDQRSPILYQVHVNESFFDQFPEWRIYIEQ